MAASRRLKRRYYPAQPSQPAASSEQHRTLIFCKPYQVLSNFTDSEGHTTSSDYIKVPRVYAVSRLDYHSVGLLILASDGQLAHRITHPKHKLPKLYWVQVENLPPKLP